MIKETVNYKAKKTGNPASAPDPGIPRAMKDQKYSQSTTAQKTNIGEEEFNKGLAFYEQDNFEEALIWFTKSAENGQKGQQIKTTLPQCLFSEPCTILERVRIGIRQRLLND